MSNQEVLENKISFIRQQLNFLEEFKNMSYEELLNNSTKRAAVERYLYLVAQASIYLAEAMVAYKKLRKPTTLREGIEILGEVGILPKDFVEKFIKMVGFRNVLAHDYGKVDARIVYIVLTTKLAEVEEFLGYIEKV